MAEYRESVCPRCGLRLPVKKSASSHRYINASPECWDLFTEVLATEYSNPSLFQQIHELTVDGYAVQHPGGKHPDKSMGIHLCGLHLMLERNIPSSKIPPLHQRLGNAVETWPHFSPPPDLGSVTVFDVALAGSEEEHAEKVWLWAHAVWQTWARHHDAVADLVARHLRVD